MSKARELAALGNAYSDGALSNRRINHNGAMQVAQRGVGPTYKSGATGEYQTVDRFGCTVANVEQFDAYVSQAADAPDGFKYSFKVDVNVAETITDSDDLIRIVHRIEGQDVQQLAYGSSSPQSLTISFWVKSSVAGTYGLSLYRNETTARTINSTYTVNSAGAWEYKTVTFAGDTTSAITSDNASRMQLSWGLLIGSSFSSTNSTSWADYIASNLNGGHTADWGRSASDYFQITGVQLEVGDTATPFEHRSYGQELALCQRYYRCGSTRLCFTGVNGRYGFAQVDAYQYRSTPSTTYTFNSSGYGTILSVGSYTPIGTTYDVSVQTDVGIGMDGIISWTADAEL